MPFVTLNMLFMTVEQVRDSYDEAIEVLPAATIRSSLTRKRWMTVNNSPRQSDNHYVAPEDGE